MRTRVVKGKGSRTRCLEVRLGHREEFDMPRLASLTSARCRTLLIPRHEPVDRGRGVLCFDISGLISLRDLLRRDVLSHQKYERLLASVAEVVGSCRALGVNTDSLLLDESQVFASFEGVLHFAAVPLSGGRRSSSSTILGLVDVLSDTRKLRFYLEEDEQIARDVALFHDESDTFDIERYCTLLSEEFGVVSRTLLNPSVEQAEYSAGAGLNKPPKDGRHAEQAGWRESRPVVRHIAAGVPPAVPVAATINWRELANPSTHADRPQPVAGGTGKVVAESLSEAAGTPASGIVEDAGVPATCELVRLNTGERYALPMDETLTLGRSTSCSVQILGNPDLSRKQATVVCEEDGCVLCDLGSANGTVVRGHRLGESESARVTLGETFQLAGEPFAIVRAQ